MDLGEINPVLLVASLMVAATPLLLAAIGELVVEKAGVLNLGVEGMMIVGAISGFAISVETGSPWLGVSLNGRPLKSTSTMSSVMTLVPKLVAC